MAITASLTGCSEVDDTLGEPFIPTGEKMQVAKTDNFNVFTYILKGDTISTSRIGTYFMGDRNNASGILNADFAAQYLEYGLSDSLYGDNPVADSMFLNLKISGFNGNKNATQTLNVYTLTKRFHYDSTYYSNFNINPIKGDLLFSTTITGGAQNFRFKFYNKTGSNSAAVTNFINKLLDTSNNAYRIDSMFYKRNPGLYFELTAPGSNGAVYAVSAKESYMEFYYRNKTTAADTSRVTRFFFEDSDYFPNSGVSILKYDYSGTPYAANIGDTSSLTLPTGVASCVVQGMGGLKSYLKFDKASIQGLRNTVINAGYEDLVVNMAKLIIKVDNSTPLVLNDAVQRVGIYNKFRIFSSTFEGTTDYNFKAEDAGYQNNFGGYLNRSLSQYEMDITSLLNEMIRPNYAGNYGVILAPDILKNMLNLNTVVLNGSASTVKPRLVITYTMIGKKTN